MSRVTMGSVVALALAIAPAANAGTPGPTESLGKAKGLEYMRAKFADVATQTTQPANCDGDAQIVGGGGSMAGQPGASTLNETYPVPPSAWQAEGNTTQGAQTLTAYAVCAGFVPDYEVSQSPLSDNTTLFALAPCDPADDPIAGGGNATGGGINMIASSPVLSPSTPEGWQPVARNSTIDDTLWDSHAVCSDLDIRHRESGRVRLGLEGSGKAIARCKQQEAVVSGGWIGKRQEVQGFPTRALVSKPWDSKDDANKVPDDGWLAKVLNLHSQGIDLVANATCKRPAQ